MRYLLSNTDRNNLFATIIAHDFTACQLKFLIFLYNVTFCVQKISIMIPNRAKLARSLGYDRVYMWKQIKILIQNDVIILENKHFSINLDTKIWQTNTLRVSRAKQLVTKAVLQQIDK